MDITALSVSIEVDMSGFIEAMEKLTALIMTLNDELKGMQGGFSDASEGINELNESADNTTEILGDVIDLATDLVEIFAGDEEEILPFFLHLAKFAVDAKKAIDDLTKSEEKRTKLPGNRNQYTPLPQHTIPPTQTTTTPQSGPKSDDEYVTVQRVEGQGTIRIKKTELDSLMKNEQGNQQYGDSTSIGPQPGIGMPPLGNDTLSYKEPYKAQDDTRIVQNIPPFLPPPNNQIDESKKKLEDFQKNLELVQQMMGKINPVLKIKVDATSLTEQSKQLGTVINQQNNYVTQINKTNDALAKEAEATANLTAKQQLQNAATEATKMTMDAAKGAISGTFESLGDSIGKMAAGEKVNPFAGIMKTLASAAKSLGAHLIELGTPLLFTPATMGQGGLYIAEGVALEAAGAAMGAIKMASGGIVSGSSIVNVGEYAGASHNPEVIAPLDKLRNMMGGGDKQVHEFRISGDSLVSVLSRVDNNNQFALGGA